MKMERLSDEEIRRRVKGLLLTIAVLVDRIRAQVGHEGSAVRTKCKGKPSTYRCCSLFVSF